ncbi:hypothetical protein P7K49_014486, partial [Saguinus oedipus]
ARGVPGRKRQARGPAAHRAGENALWGRAWEGTGRVWTRIHAAHPARPPAGHGRPSGGPSLPWELPSVPDGAGRAHGGNTEVSALTHAPQRNPAFAEPPRRHVFGRAVL